MELRQLNYFIAAYEEGSITRAAQRLNIVQPAISQQLAKLEAELGGALFQRTPTGLRPTFLGDDAYRLLRPLVHQLQSARHDLSADRSRIGGALAIGAIASMAMEILPETLIALGAQYPDVTFRVTGGYSAEMLEMLRIGKIDIAIINHTDNRRTDFVEIELFNERLAFICAPDHPVAMQNGRIRASDVKRLVLPTTRHGLRDVISIAARAAALNLDPQLECDEIATLEKFVEHGGYVTILPPIALLSALTEGRLIALPIAPGVRRRVVCAYSNSRPLSRAAEVFIRGLRQRLNDVPKDLISVHP
ncbi:LysR family transcriptional regulator [Pseudochrobactrum asaccharolyticum]|uniref:LysR family transcriptional regulator n=1 Tax=Pseudochrobactrum asaccharolyticum TaxID=354351 RepID=A0A366DM71_9HYPH|nr:LysR family transcriptional regulator [Pseudochrobactrum asaccharolyticum]MBX8803159.1 LysR family transcriptional regulator [Ochrobactrum sp. MR28]MBX8818741.1 LysR family transcriptional regulator [Ochrobactrum sp. MR31]RBO90404.1 LysR family transcriptional regulator [Pseudochrobactrum asaccharolyticum]